MTETTFRLILAATLIRVISGSAGNTARQSFVCARLRIVGQTASSNFPTKNALLAAPDVNGQVGRGCAFITKTNTLDNPLPPPPPDPTPAPTVKVTGVAVGGKKLHVFGEHFSADAIIMLDGVEWATLNDSQNPTTVLMSKKAGKKVKPGKSVMIQVKNADGTMSPAFPYVRPAN